MKFQTCLLYCIKLSEVSRIAVALPAKASTVNMFLAFALLKLGGFPNPQVVFDYDGRRPCSKSPPSGLSVGITVAQLEPTKPGGGGLGIKTTGSRLASA